MGKLIENRTPRKALRGQIEEIVKNSIEIANCPQSKEERMKIYNNFIVETENKKEIMRKMTWNINGD